MDQPELNLKFCDREAFSAITGVVGIPLKLDEPTANETRSCYASILVEIKANAYLAEEAHIYMYDGENLVQKIEYEWTPPCKTCAHFDHVIENYHAKKVWI